MNIAPNPAPGGRRAAFALLALVLALPAPALQEPAAPPTRLPEGASLRVRGDVRIAPGRWLRPPVDRSGKSAGRAGVVVAEGLSGVTIDLTGVELRGAPEGADLDAHRGFGLVLRDCQDVTVLGGTFGGYKVCVFAERCRGLEIRGATFDGWFAQRLFSTPAAENPADWLWPHDNDAGEWVDRYGAAISLTDCEDAEVSGCKGRNGQNGVLLTRTRRTSVFDNDFSFLSGWGLGMYRSSRNVVSHNAFDYCVRGYSHETYWRGQDSAGILMFERCSENVIAYNSATHSGDGLFLFGGQDVVEGRALERGETDVGGSDRNLFYRNDFSYAVANGIEATFSSDNMAIENMAVGCHQHGVWGGYSRRMVILGNSFEGTLGGGVTIEHGQDCVIARNVFHGCEIGVELYWDEDPQFVQGVYGEHFDTDSRDHWILGNSFSDNDADLVVVQSSGIAFQDNVFQPEAAELTADRLVAHEERELPRSERGVGDEGLLARIAGVGGWRPSGRVDDVSLRLVEAPPELLETAEALAIPDVPGELDAVGRASARERGLQTIVMGQWGPWDFPGGAPKPEPRPPGGELAGARWESVWFSWKDGPDPRGMEENLTRWRALADAPLVRRTIETWEEPWGADPEVRRLVGQEHFGLLARTEVDLVGGRYHLMITSDDGVRMRVDGETVLENWTWHAPTRDEAWITLPPGRSVFELEYFQIDGATALIVDLEYAGPN